MWSDKEEIYNIKYFETNGYNGGDDMYFSVYFSNINDEDALIKNIKEKMMTIRDSGNFDYYELYDLELKHETIEMLSTKYNHKTTYTKIVCANFEKGFGIFMVHDSN